MLKKKGVFHLLRLYNYFKPEDFKKLFNLRCNGTLSAILAHFIKNYYGIA